MADLIYIKTQWSSNENVHINSFETVDAFCEFIKNYIEEWACQPTVLHTDYIEFFTHCHASVKLYFPADLYYEVESIHLDFMLEILPA